MSTPTGLRDLLRLELTNAVRARDRTVAAAVRSALGALDNAEAVPVPEPTGGVVGVGGSEVPRRELDAEEERRVVAAELAELEAAATTFAGLGLSDRVAEAHRGADVLRAVLLAVGYSDS
ncbi:hypothetical protein RDV89_11885 [Nocardioides zeae]|uniref:GatB/YqeY n=1 Tax=Nocardioides imazamoxiresistens TaxID=3231893 RepID=A0ABU3PY82_9ACTN|nr:hypothetical protein [Nocardioides zeae]MDT9593772.1 hypothetical protein [Nocardioides zeae]